MSHISSAVVTSTKFHCDLVNSTWLTRSNIITLLCSSAPQSLITSSQWSLADVTTALLWWLLQNFTVIWSIQPGLSQEISSHYPAVQLLRAWSHHHNEVWQMSPQLCCGDFYQISLWFGQFNLAYHKKYHTTLQFSSSEPDHIITMKFGRCHHSSAVVTSTKFHCDFVSSTWLTRSNIITLLCSSAPQSLITSSQWSLADVTTALLWWLLPNFTVILSVQPGLPEAISSPYSAVQLLRAWSHHHNEVWQMSPQLCCGDFYKISLWFCQFNLAYQKQYHHTTLQFSSSEPDHIITMKFGRCHHSSAVVTSTKFHCDFVSSTWLTRSNIITLLCSSAPQSLITSSQWSLANVTTALLWWLLQNFTVILSVQPGLPEAISSHYPAVQLLRAWSHHHNEVWQMSPQLCRYNSLFCRRLARHLAPLCRVRRVQNYDERCDWLRCCLSTNHGKALSRP